MCQIAPPAPVYCFWLVAAAAIKTVLWRQGLLCDGVADLAAVFDAATCSVSKLCNRDVQIRSGHG